MDDHGLWALLLGVLGLVFGSFIATVVLRWPLEKSALEGRSYCDACGRRLRAHELVPVFSYLVQRGRCRSCGATIDTTHLLIELAAMLVGVCAGVAAPGVEGAAGAGFGWLLLALAALDLTLFWLPNSLTGALAATGFAAGMIGIAPPLADRVAGGAAGFLALWLVAALYRRARGRMGLGGGDPKLFGAIGLWLGWRALPPVLLIACVMGLCLVLAMRIAGREVRATDRLPFGVMLAAAAWMAWLASALAP
ncbi:MAG: prepilin peptidase [Pseudomonadota bacterium]